MGKLREKIIRMTIFSIKKSDYDLFAKMHPAWQAEYLDDFKEYIEKRDKMMEEMGGKFCLGALWRALPNNEWTRYRVARSVAIKNGEKPSKEVLQLATLELLDNKNPQ